MESHPLAAITARIKSATRILVLTHIRPDGDALGSQLGLGAILRGLGKEVFLYGEAEVSSLYRFLPGVEEISRELPELSAFDCAIALDCGDAYRLGREVKALLTVKPFIVIDHHLGHQNFGDLRWVDPNRASSGELVYELAIALRAEISQVAAYCLYTAIVSDTGSFQYSSTSADTFRVARELILKGVKPVEVAAKLFDNFSLTRLHLLSRVLSSLRLYADGRIAVITASSELFSETGADPADTEGFVNYPRALSCVRVAVLLKEAEPGMVSVSIRSKGPDCDVAKVAMAFGGGGHRNAAGFKLGNTTIAELSAKLLPALQALVV